MKKLLLIEFASEQTPQRGLFFPYLNGLAGAGGVDSLWLRYGVPADIQMRNQGEGVDLGPDQGLEEQCQRFKPTHLVFSHRPAAPMLGRVLAQVPQVRIGVAGESSLFPGEWSSQLFLLDDVAARACEFLSLPEVQKESLFEAALPDFSLVPANPAARDLPLIPYLMLAEGCFYRKSLEHNPWFEVLGGASCDPSGGCSFCVQIRLQKTGMSFSAEGTRGQLAALARTLPAHRERLGIRLLGGILPRHGELLGRLILEAGVEPSDWLLDIRVDTLLRWMGELEGLCRVFEGRGHKLHLSLLGIENFSAPELERMNKGVDPLTNLKAVAALLDLEQRHPETFSFREHGGLSMILFTPWTTPEDLFVNLSIAWLARLDVLSGKLLGSRLRLMKGLPLTELAAHDGAIVPEHTYPEFRTAARKLYDEEVPWRFLNPLMEQICRVFVRLDSPSDDELGNRISSLLSEAAQRGARPLAVALALLEEVELGGEQAWTAESLVETLVGRFLELPRVGWDGYSSLARPRSSFFRSAIRGLTHLNSGLKPLVALTRAGVKPVGKLDGILAEELAGIEAAFDLPNAVRFVQPGSDGRLQSIFFSNDPAAVARAVELTRTLQERGDEGEESLVTRIGVLLGYPDCCTSAFQRDVQTLGPTDATLHLARRLAEPGPIPWEYNPWALTGGLPESGALERGDLANHVPCSLKCEATLALAKRKLEVLAGVYAPEEMVRIKQACSNPWLVFIEGDGTAMELIPEGPVSERFSFKPGLINRSSQESDLARQGDEVEILPDRLRILREGRLLMDLTARAWVWWHARSFQQDLWEPILKTRARQLALAVEDHPGQGREEPGSEGGGSPGPRPEAPVMILLEELLDKARGEGRLLGGYGLRELVWQNTSTALATLTNPEGDSIKALIEDASAPRFFLDAGSWRISHPSDSQPDTQARMAAFRALAGFLLSRSESRG